MSYKCECYATCIIKQFFDKGKIQRYWIEIYCKSRWQQCVRYNIISRGKRPPDDMLPNGSYLDNLGEVIE